ncbi:MAG: LysR family transcriptional regulator [Oceanospirillum sp.]|nr:LysR family transcriptional regulator [Oceanospirillum sp.]
MSAMKDSNCLSSRLSRVNLNLLVAFYALYQQRHLTRAAEQVNLSQPAMSHSLKKLRLQFEDELFTKTAEGMLPTPMAKQIFQLIEQGLLQLDQALASAHSFEPEKAVREFRVGIMDFMIHELVPYLVKTVNQTAPGISFNILYAKISSPEIAYKLLQEQSLDLALTQFEYQPNDKNCELLYSEELMCIADREHYGEKDELTLEEFLDAPHVALSHREDEPILVNKRLESLGMNRKVIVKTPYVTTLPSLLSGTNMVTVINQYAADLIIPGTRLKTYHPPIAFSNLQICQIWEERKEHDPGIRWLRGVIQQCMQTRIAPQNPSTSQTGKTQ